MTLPADVARCPGQKREYQPGEWPFPSQPEYCIDCARRTEGIRDYVAGAPVPWMGPPKETPCQMRIEPEAKK